jgi:hypothetical protein
MSVATISDPVELIAQHFSARSAGAGRWIARCPVHSDRRPSLSIARGRDGRVLVRCWVGCDLTAVLQSAGLSIGNLFPAGLPPTPGQLATVDLKRERHLAALREERWTVEQMRVLWRALDREQPVVARKLMLMPNDAPGAATLTAHFHTILAAKRVIDSAFIGDTD